MLFITIVCLFVCLFVFACKKCVVCLFVQIYMLTIFVYFFLSVASCEGVFNVPLLFDSHVYPLLWQSF